MGGFISQLQLIWNFLLNILTNVFNLYVTYPVLCAVLAVWVVRKLSHIFNVHR